MEEDLMTDVSYFPCIFNWHANIALHLKIPCRHLENN